MNTLIKTVSSTVLSLSLITGTTAYADDYVIGLSPYQEKQVALSDVKKLLEFTASREPNDRIVFWDAYNNTKIAAFTIPEGKAYSSPKARLKYKENKSALSDVVKFAKSVHVPMPKMTYTVKLPQLLTSVAHNKREGEKLDVIVLGSPFYHDETDSAFSMLDGIVPSDGHLSASRGNSVFSATNPNKLKDVRVHLAFDESVEFNNDRHAFYVERFWSLLTQQQGGEFVSFSRGLSGALDRVKDKAPALQADYQLDSTGRIEMIRYRDTELNTSLYDALLSDETLSEAEVTHAQNVTIGLTWTNCKACDLDVYVKANERAKALSYKQPKTPEGVYFKDFMDSPKTGFETVELTTMSDLKDVQIVVNFYAGNAPDGVEAELRLSVNGKTYAKPLLLPASTGNKGADVNGVFSNHKNTANTVILSAFDLVSA